MGLPRADGVMKINHPASPADCQSTKLHLGQFTKRLKLSEAAKVSEIDTALRAYSLTLFVPPKCLQQDFAALGVVELFRLVKRESEVSRKILYFPFRTTTNRYASTDYYPVIDGKDTNYYRHPICVFSFTVPDGNDK